MGGDRLGPAAYSSGVRSPEGHQHGRAPHQALGDDRSLLTLTIEMRGLMVPIVSLFVGTSSGVTCRSAQG